MLAVSASTALRSSSRQLLLLLQTSSGGGAGGTFLCRSYGAFVAIRAMCLAQSASTNIETMIELFFPEIPEQPALQKGA